MTTERKSPGYLLYDGPSLLDGQRIVMLVNSLNSVSQANRKTGPAAQTCILRPDILPTEAAKTGADRSICGDCALRPMTSGVCYVELGRGVWQTYQSLIAGKYPKLILSKLAKILRHRYVRIGSYGDPAAVPTRYWLAMTRAAAHWTGYTHQWRNCDPELKKILMASVDNEAEADEAHAMGWRTFRHRLPEEPLRLDEISCPASDEAGKRLQCCDCGACQGHRFDRPPSNRSVSIIVHGRAWKQAQWRRHVAAQEG